MMFTRRETIHTLAGLGLAAMARGEPERRRIIEAENAKPGTRAWMLAKPRVDPGTKYRCPWIEGFASPRSVRAGDTVRFHVSTNPASRWKLKLYRMGYYGGDGGRLVAELGPFDGTTQTDPPVGAKRARV